MNASWASSSTLTPRPPTFRSYSAAHCFASPACSLRSAWRPSSLSVVTGLGRRGRGAKTIVSSAGSFFVIDDVLCDQRFEFLGLAASIHRGGRRPGGPGGFVEGLEQAR